MSRDPEGSCRRRWRPRRPSCGALAARSGCRCRARRSSRSAGRSNPFGRRRRTPERGRIRSRPSWFWPHMQPAFGALVDQLGLASFPQAQDGDVIIERMSRETPRRYQGMPQEPQSMRLSGGTSALVRALARDIPSDRMLLGARVTAMSLAAGGVELALARTDGTTSALFARHVIAALPPRLLEATVGFTPAQDGAIRAKWRDTPTWMAPHAKFFALYDRAFWREAGLSGTAQSTVGPLFESGRCPSGRAIRGCEAVSAPGSRSPARAAALDRRRSP